MTNDLLFSVVQPFLFFHLSCLSSKGDYRKMMGKVFQREQRVDSRMRLTLMTEIFDGLVCASSLIRSRIDVTSRDRGVDQISRWMI